MGTRTNDHAAEYRKGEAMRGSLAVESNTGDDCVATESGKNPDVQYGPSQNQVFQNCVMHCRHGVVALGSERGAGVRQLYVRDRSTRESAPPDRGFG